MSETTNDGFPEAVDTTIPADQTASTADATTEAAQTPEQTDPETETTETKPQQDPEPKRRPWWEKRIAETAFEAREAKRRADVAEAALAQVRRAPTTEAASTPAEVVPAMEVERRATELADERMFLQACADIAAAGEAKHANFDESRRTLTMLGEMPQAFFEGIIALGKDDGARVYYELGKKPEEAARIFSLPPIKMAMELTKMASATPKIAAVSRVPDPIEPITSARVRSGAEPDAAKDPVAWTTWFNAERRKLR